MPQAPLERGHEYLHEYEQLEYLVKEMGEVIPSLAEVTVDDLTWRADSTREWSRINSDV